jgi:hypothetical protein
MAYQDPQKQLAAHIQSIKDLDFNEAWEKTRGEAARYSRPPKPKRIETFDRKVFRVAYYPLLTKLLFWFTSSKTPGSNEQELNEAWRKEAERLLGPKQQ